MSQQAARWCFTINNYSDESLEQITALYSRSKFVFYGKEVGLQGTPHLQGYCVLKRSQRLAFVKALLPTAHLERANGSHEQNIAYCSKENDVTSLGEVPATQQETNKANARRQIELAKAGDLDTIQEEFPKVFLSRYRVFKELAKDFMSKPDDLAAPCGVWIYGESGSGKTTAARENYGDYFPKQANKWWDGYQGQGTVVIEDLDPVHHVLGHHLKLWTDKWSFTAEDKGSARWLRPMKVVITSQYSIEEVFPDPKTCAALNRRCEVIHMHLPADAYPALIPPALQ